MANVDGPDSDTYNRDDLYKSKKTSRIVHELSSSQLLHWLPVYESNVPGIMLMVGNMKIAFSAGPNIVASSLVVM